MPATPALFTDADNTLWNTDAVYARAQHGLLAALGRHFDVPIALAAADALAFLRRIDQRIAAQHPKGLRYPAALLALGLRRALRGDEAGAVDLAVLLRDDDSDLGVIVDQYVEALRALPQKRRGVSQGLKIAHEMQSPVTVVTEGAKKRCIDLLDRHRLSKFVNDCVSMKKSVDAYRSLSKGMASGLMVGDQPDRDILFASRAGLRTCYFPGNFVPFWSERVAVVPDFQIESYAEVPVALRALQGAESRSNRVPPPKRAASLGRRRS